MIRLANVHPLRALSVSQPKFGAVNGSHRDDLRVADDDPRLR